MFCLIIRILFLFLISIYRRVPRILFFGQCRFIPCCSLYAQRCLNRYSVFMSISLIIRRILKCNPICSAAVVIDEVP